MHENYIKTLIQFVSSFRTIVCKLPMAIQIAIRIHAVTSTAVNRKMQANKTMADINGCDKLSVNIAFPLGCAPSKKTMAKRPTTKAEMNIQLRVVDMVTASEITILMTMVNVAANKPGSIANA